MIRPTIAHIFLACSLVAAALFTGVIPRSVAPVLALTTTTINFDDLAPGTLVTNQYDAQGVDFDPSAGLTPVIAQVASSDAQSGTQVADISQCFACEFYVPNVAGTFVNAAQNVSVYVGYFPNSATPGDTAGITLTALDSQKNAITSDSQNVTEGQGFHTKLSVTSTSANIAGFKISARQEGDDDKDLAIDDLTFDNPAGVSPDFSLSPAASLVNVYRGTSSTDNLVINRLNGSTGGVSFDAGTLPTGITASFSPNPATASSTTLNITAAPDAPLPSGNTLPAITVTATPRNASVGATAHSVVISIQVQQSFFIGAGSETVGVAPCSTVQIPITVTWEPGFSDDVTLSLSGVPSDDQATLNPTTVSHPTNGTAVAKSTLTVTSQTDISGPSAKVTVTGTSGQITIDSSPISVSRVPPSISSVKPGKGNSYQALSTNVTISGQGFCVGTKVAFGNAQARDFPQQLSTDGTQMQVHVPWLATSGPVYALPPGDAGDIHATGTAVSPVNFTVDSYRNTDGFSFNNSDAFQSRVGGYSFGDVSDVFGYDQTHVGVNPCWPLGDCSITTPIPDPFALLFWGIADAALQGGQCFGFSLASQRLIHGDQSYSAFPLQPGATTNTVWNLQGPDAAGGPSGSVAHFIHLTHMEQFSAEALHYWLTSATVNAVAGDGQSILGQVQSALNNGDHPLIELRNGTEGHVVVAYAVSGTTAGTISVYNPNAEFTASEDSDHSGSNHANVMSTSQITVDANGHWNFPGFSPAWHAGPGSIVVVPYETVPVHPTLPTTLSGLWDLVVGDAKVSQVTNGQGQTLLKPDGTLNKNAKTGITDATQLATLSGSAKPGPAIFLFGKAGAYNQTIVGKQAGQYQDTLLGHGMAASVTAGSAKGLKDSVSLLPNTAGVQFGPSGTTEAPAGRKVTAQVLVHAADGSERNASVATIMPTGGADGISFDGAEHSVTVKSSSRPATYALTLSWTGANGQPQTFVTPKETIEPGDAAVFTPATWSSLQGTAVKLKVVHKNGKTSTSTVKNTLRPAGRYSLQVKVAGTKSRLHKLTIATKFKRLVKGSTALLSWEVLHGKVLIRHHSAVIPAKKLHKGLITRTFSFKAAAGAKYTFKGKVVLFSPSDSGSVLSQTASREKGFTG